MAEQTVPEELLSKASVFDVKTPIYKIMPIIDERGTAVITKGDEFYGIVDFRAMYRSKQSASIKRNATVERYAVRTPKITASTPLDDVISYFYKSQSTAMPYVSRGLVRGVLDRYTLLKMLLSVGYMRGINVQDVMTSPVLAIEADANISQARAAMARNRLNRLVVLDNDKFVGLITNHDIVMRYTKPQERLPEMKTKVYTPTNVPIKSVMESNPATIDYTAGIEECVRNFIERRVSSLIVTKKSKPIGVVTISDVLAGLMSRRRIEGNRIILSGFNAKSYDYEDEIREMVREFMDKMEKLQKLKVSYVTLKIKDLKNNRYEVKMRVAFERQGAIAMDHTSFLLDRTVAELLDKAKREVLKMKDKESASRYTTKFAEE